MKPLLTTLVATAMLVGSASAQPIADHLKCYKVKDSQPKASYTANLGGLVPESGCLIKVPGNLLCVETTKDITAGTPPGGADNSGAAGRFLCYKLKCPKATLPAVQWHDQFGSRQLTPSAPKILCAPEIVAASTTTTETSTTTTTTACPAGDVLCGTACVNTATDPTNCGTCGTVCPSGPNSTPICVSGQCTLSCSAGFANCDGNPANGCEADLSSDSNNCGSCGDACPAGESCTLSVCSCPAGETRCGISCVNTLTDPNNCGMCGAVCPSGFGCLSGSCLTSCTTDSQCVSTDFCNGGVCTPKLGPGASCTVGDQCISGICSTGVCL